RHTLVDFDVLRILHFFLVGVPFDNLEIAKPEDECKTEQEYYDQDYIDPGLQYLSVYGFKAFYFSSFQYNSILFHISICKAILSYIPDGDITINICFSVFIIVIS